MQASQLGKTPVGPPRFWTSEEDTNQPLNGFVVYDTPDKNNGGSTRSLAGIPTCEHGACLLFRYKRRSKWFANTEPKCKCWGDNAVQSTYGYTLDLQEFTSGSREESRFDDYRNIIWDQFGEKAYRRLLCEGFIFGLRNLENPRHDGVYLRILTHIVAGGGDKGGTAAVQVKTIETKPLNKQLREGRDDQMGGFNEWRNRLKKNNPGHRGIGIAIDFVVQYPAKSVSFGVQLGIPLLEEYLRKRQQLTDEILSWEKLGDMLSDADGHWERSSQGGGYMMVNFVRPKGETTRGV